MYNRTNYNPINPTEENQNTITTGFSIIHTQSFDELKELFQKRKEKEKESDEEEEQENGEQGQDKEIPNTLNNREGIKDDDETE